ncbi:MAG: VWA domain-containing protein, partial [Deltaproteobacteria bacterium]|nr:VWA domain-containing protein [Deltaproteobacteria bacterium]
MHRLAALAVVITASAACHTASIVVGDLEEVVAMKAIPTRELDILFVIDDSSSMYPQQTALAVNFPRMIDVLGQLDGGLPNLHIGIVTSDLGTTSVQSPTPAPPVGGCDTGAGKGGALQTNGAPVADLFISDVDDGNGGRLVNYAGELRDVFATMAQVGAGGCGFEQHLAAMRRSFTNPANAGFIRPEANLAVVIIADEDDCSILSPDVFSPDSPTLGALSSFRCARFGITCDEPDLATPGPKTGCAPAAGSTYIEDVQPFVDALIAVKGDPRRVMVAGIVGDPNPVETTISPPYATPQRPEIAPSCTFAGAAGDQVAFPSVRLSAFLDAFPGRSQRTSLCSADLSSPLAIIGDSAKKLVGDPCLDTSILADAAPDVPGIQPACEVLDRRDSAPDAPPTPPPRPPPPPPPRDTPPPPPPPPPNRPRSPHPPSTGSP